MHIDREAGVKSDQFAVLSYQCRCAAKIIWRRFLIFTCKFPASSCQSPIGPPQIGIKVQACMVPVIFFRFFKIISIPRKGFI